MHKLCKNKQHIQESSEFQDEKNRATLLCPRPSSIIKGENDANF